MKKDLAKYTLKLLEKKGADTAIVSQEKNDIVQIKFSNSRIGTSMLWSSASLGVFASFGRRIVATSIEDMSEQGVSKIVKQCASFAKLIEKNNDFNGITKAPQRYRKMKLWHKDAESADGVDIIKKAVSAAQEKGVARSDGIFRKIISDERIITSEGIDASSRSTELYFSIRSLIDKYATGHEVAVSKSLKNLNYLGAAENAAGTALMSRNPRKAVYGEFDVVFSPLSFANMLEKVGDSASIFNVDAGMSCFGGKQGKKVAAAKVNIYDDGTMPEGLGTSPFDAEGTPSQRTQIISNGVLKNFLHNTSTAIKHNTRSTGNAGLISPEPTNIVLEPGRHSLDSLISSVKKGFYITNLWYTRFQNYTTGDFSTIPRDGIFYVENGRIKYPVKNIRVSANLIEMMKNISMIGRNRVQVQSWETETPVFTPPVLVKDVRITGPGE